MTRIRSQQQMTQLISITRTFYSTYINYLYLVRIAVAIAMQLPRDLIPTCSTQSS